MATSDCGCKGSKNTSPPQATASQPLASPVPAPAASAASASNPAVDVRGFRALNPVDGLFLRAEHLQAIQDYGRSLTQTLATATGPGVVEGCGVTLGDQMLLISPGVAITTHGRLLRLGTELKVPLDQDHLEQLESPGGFWRVELHWASATSGAAPVYGSLCNDGCGDGSVIRPWRDEGVRVRLVADQLTFSSSHPRNALASAYFERERALGYPWLVPTGAEKDVPPIERHDWEDDTPLPPERGVPLALLWQEGEQFRLDVWTARRLVDGPLSDRTWRNRLAMRPWSVFLAQVLQFQDELAEQMIQAARAHRAKRSDDRRSGVREKPPMAEAVRTFFARTNPQNPICRTRLFQEAAAEIEAMATAERPTEGTGPVRAALRFDELPPAGYLPAEFAGVNLQDALKQRVEERGISLRVRKMRADQIADEVLAAQHRDRIPLRTWSEGADSPKLDILVPSEPADKAELHTPDYGWVAFVRRGPGQDLGAPPPKPRDEVHLYLHGRALDYPDTGTLDTSELDGQIEEILHNLDHNPHTLRFAADASEFSPSDQDFLAMITNKLGHEKVQLNGLIAVASDEERRGLTALRATHLGASLGLGRPLPIWATTGFLDHDAIVVLYTR